MKKTKTWILSLLFILTILLYSNQSVFAQIGITKKQAIDLALTKNPESTLSTQRVEQQQALKGSAFNLPDLQVFFQSTNGTSQRISVFQSIAYPGVYCAQAKTQKEKVKLYETEKEITLHHLVYKVNAAYNEAQYLLQKTILLTRKDSLYNALNNFNQIRFNVGQLTGLEKINSEAKYHEISFTLQQTKVALLDSKIQLAMLIGKPNDTSYTPIDKFSKLIPHITILGSYDSSIYQSNPIIEYNNQYEGVQKSILKVERRKKVPGLLVGYLNQGPTNTTSTYYRMQFGLTLPIWYWSYQSSIRSAKKGIDIAHTQKQITSNQLGTEYSKALSQYIQQAENIQYFEKTGLKQAVEIKKAAQESYQQGSIGYFVYLQNLELAFQIEENYLECLRKFNQAVIALDYITGDTNQ